MCMPLHVASTDYGPEHFADALRARRELGEGACMAVLCRGKERKLRVFGSRAEFDAFEEEEGVARPRLVRELALTTEGVATTLRIKKASGGELLHGHLIFSSQDAMLKRAGPLGHTFFITLNHMRHAILGGNKIDNPSNLITIRGQPGAFVGVYAFASFASEVEWFSWEQKLLPEEKVCFERVMCPEKAPGACGRVRPFFDMDSKGGERAAKFPAEAGAHTLEALESRMWRCVVKHATAVALDWWGRELTLREHFRVGVTCEEFREYKLSNHIVILGLGSVTMEGARQFALEVKRRAVEDDPFSASTIDDKVYGSSQNLRMVGHCKADSPGRFVRPHPLFEGAERRDFLLLPTSAELQQPLEPPEGTARADGARGAATGGERAAKRHKTEVRSVDVSTVQAWLDASGGVYAGEEVQKVSKSPNFPNSVMVFFKGVVQCHHISRPHSQNPQHVSLIVQDNGTVLQRCTDDNNGCMKLSHFELEIEAPDNVLEALWPEQDVDGAASADPMEVDHGDDAPESPEPPDPPGADGSGEALPAAVVLPTFRKAAVEYVIRTQFRRHHDTTVEDTQPPPIEEKKYNKAERKKMKKEMKEHMGQLEARREAAKARGERRDTKAEAREDREASEVVRFCQRFKSNGTHCPHLGAAHPTSTPIEFVARWWAPMKKKVEFGDRLRCTLSLCCADPRCNVRDCTVGMHEDVEHYAAYKEQHEQKAFRVTCPKVAFGFEAADDVYVLNSKGLEDQYMSAPSFLGTTFAKVYASDPGARTFTKMDMVPPGAIVDCPKDTYNMWRGFAAERLPSNDPPVEPTLWLETSRAVFGNEHADFLINCQASMIQFPGRKTDVVITLYGPEGCGKGALVDRTLGRIMGGYYASSFNPEALTEKHSELNNGKILIVFDDFNPAKGAKVAEEIKSRSTAEKVTYERKGIQSVQLTNYANLWFLTNRLNALSYKGDCRRNVLIECRNVPVSNAAEYWAKYEAWIAVPKNLRAVYDYLKGLDLSNVSLRRDRPQTQILKDHQFAALEPEYQFLFDTMSKRFAVLGLESSSEMGADIVCDLDSKSFLEGSWTITNTKLYDEYARWWETQHYPANKTQKVKAALGQWLRYKVKEEGGFKNDAASRSSTYHFDNKLLVKFLGEKGFDFDSMRAKDVDEAGGGGGGGPGDEVGEAAVN